MEAPPRTKSKLRSHPSDGMTIHVPVGDRAVEEIIDPRSFEDGGPAWIMRHGNPETIRHTVAALLESYDYLLSDSINMTEATRRLRLMRQYRRAAAQNIPAES